MKMLAQSLLKNNQKVLVTGLLTLLVSLVSCYVYFLSMSVVHVVFRKEADQQAQELASDLAALETQYIDAKHTVSERMAALDQLKETDAKIFVERSQSALAFRTTVSK